jgi:acyl-coenzyme A synthetase/AMP-(fatty) acid ligase
MLTGRIFDWAARTPDRTAVIYNGQAVSYRVLAGLIAKARGYFAARGFTGPGYAVLATRSLMDFWILSLALRSLGLTTLAIGVAAMLEELGLPDVRGVFTMPGESWPQLGETCNRLGVELATVTLGSETPLGLAHEHNSPGGHILLTSATTGAHKMVLMSAEVDSVFLPRNAELFGMGRDSVVDVFDFPAWTGVGYRIAATAWVGGGAVLIEQTGVAHQSLLRPGLTHACLIPAKLDEIFAAPHEAFPCDGRLKLIVTAGAMTRRQAEQAKARITPHVINLLSSTEGSIVAMTPLVTEEDHRWQIPLAGRVFEIVDEDDRPVRQGEIGRIRVRTQGGPTDYLHNEAATQAFFKDGHFYPGDLAMIRADGRLALQGRVTDIINVRGNKIPPAAIEDRLIDGLGVRAVCLFSMQDEAGEEEIYVVIESESAIASDRLTAAIHRELDGFPRAKVLYLPALARNANGKIVRAAVRAQLAGEILRRGA